MRLRGAAGDHLGDQRQVHRQQLSPQRRRAQGADHREVGRPLPGPRRLVPVGSGARAPEALLRRRLTEIGSPLRRAIGFGLKFETSAAVPPWRAAEFVGQRGCAFMPATSSTAAPRIGRVDGKQTFNAR